MGTLWTGGKIYTLQNEKEVVDAIYVEKGKIKAVGAEEDLKNQFSENISEIIDIKGNTLYPGLVDSHLHLIGHGEKLMRLDLSEMKSEEEIIGAIKLHVEDAKPGEWIIGEGWNENQLPNQKIFHRTELDELSPENPLILSRICRHAILANSSALELAGISETTPDPVGGIIVRDKSGKVTGYLLDKAQDLVKSVIPPVTENYLQKALTTSIQDCLRLGLVGGHSEDLHYYGGFKHTYDTFVNVIDGKTMKFRTNLLVHHEVVDDMHKHGFTFGSGTDFIEFGAMKIFVDGALGGRTALLSKPYNDKPDTNGVAIHSLDELKELVKKARDYKMPVAVHAIGDLAFEYIIDAIEEYPPLEGQRDRLIHAQILRRDLIDRAIKLPIILDLQPTFVASDFPWVIERVGKENMKYCYAWKTLLSTGFHCAGGSDAPIESVSPLLGIYTAVTRKKADNDSVYYPEEKISVFDALKLYTSGSAFAINKESISGIIAPGYTADFTILDQDLFTIPEEDILKTNVKMTVVDNTIMYQNID